MKTKLKGDVIKEFKVIMKHRKEQIMKKSLELLKEATPVDTGEARDGWKIKDSKIINNVGHIEHLNKGSSKQAPSHFIERVLLAQDGLKPNGTIV